VQQSHPEGSAQGGDLGSFLRESGCDVRNNDPYLVIPIPDVRPDYNTAAALTGNPTIAPGFALPDSLASAFRSERYCAES